ncbi:MAG: DEAD/DEAH box helicase [Candidatus Thermoplasmatota archaeon]
MHDPPLDDVRLRHATSERWERAAVLRERGWLHDVRAAGNVASAICVGLVGVRVQLDRASGESACECRGEAPCEHALALALEVGLVASARTESSLPPPGEPPARPRSDPIPDRRAGASPPPTVSLSSPPPLLIALDPTDPGRVTLSGQLTESQAESLAWVWWRRDGAASWSGEARTLAQALQLLRDHDAPAVAAAPENGSLAGSCALFRQRALGEPVTIRLLDAASIAALELARLLADRGARPFPGRLPAELWSVDEPSFAAWCLLAWRYGAEVRPDPTLNPHPLTGVEVLLDPGCLPGRLKAPEDPALHAFLVHALGGEPVVDAEHGHVLIPASRVADVEDGLRALGADVTYKRLAPPHERYLEWPSELPEDLHGARPRLREHYAGELDRVPPRMRQGVTLAGYQREAVAFLLHHEHTCLLADDMGLGKTLESIAAAQCLEGRVLVVAPASAREVWRHEVAKFTLESSVVWGPGAEPTLPEGAKYVVTGYSNLEPLADALRPEDFALVILDESHYVKNAASGRAKLVHEKLARIPRRLVISGTPVMNSPEEIRAQLAFLHPDEWSDADWFKHRFGEPFEEGSIEVREQVLSRLRQFLDGVMIRREKATALPDLPPKTILWHRVPMPAEARRAYVALEDEFADAFEKDASSATGKLEHLRQAALAGKMPSALAFLRERIAAGEKLVVFTRYRNAMTSLEAELADAHPVSLSGDTTPEGRVEAERRFQEDADCRVFLGQLVAAGTAITLVAGTHAVFLDLSWNPADHRQAMDRIHRRGQTKPVTAHFFLAEGTVDEDMARVLDEKGRMMDMLLSPTGEGGAAIKGGARLVGKRLLERRGVPAARDARAEATPGESAPPGPLLRARSVI